MLIKKYGIIDSFRFVMKEDPNYFWVLPNEDYSIDNLQIQISATRADIEWSQDKINWTRIEKGYNEMIGNYDNQKLYFRVQNYYDTGCPMTIQFLDQTR